MEGIEDDISIISYKEDKYDKSKERKDEGIISNEDLLNNVLDFIISFVLLHFSYVDYNCTIRLYLMNYFIYLTFHPL